MAFPVIPQNVRLDTDAPERAASAFANTFKQTYEKARVERALRAVQSGDEKAMGDLMAADPQLGMRVQQQMREQQEAARDKTSREQANAYYVSQNPSAKPFIEAGGQAKDLAALDLSGARTDGASARAQQTLLRNSYDIWVKAGSIVSGIAPNDPSSGAQAKALARGLFGDNEAMTRFIDALPDAMTPEQIAQLQRQTMTGKDQVAASARAQGLDIQQQRVDETVRHNGVTEAQGQQRVETYGRSVDLGHADRQEGFDVRRDEGAANRAQSNTNSERQAETTRGSSNYSGGGRRGGRSAPSRFKEGDVARNKNDGKLYVRRNGQWVPK